MEHVVYHMMITAIMPGLFLITAATPGEVLGCRTRGLIALTIALVSGLAAVGAAMIGAKGRMKGIENCLWCLGSTFILVLPVVALVILA
jgi:hypothetical protein